MLEVEKSRVLDLPRGAPLRVVADGDIQEATFHHVDGSYSLCTLDRGAAIFHLYIFQKLELIDGRWELCE